jgi:BolA protein
MTNHIEARMGGRADRIASILKTAFNPVRLEITDDSARHAGHRGAAPGGETHYSVTMVSDDFTGRTRLERSRMVNAALAAEFEGGLHALSMVLRAPLEQKS